MIRTINRSKNLISGFILSQVFIFNPTFLYAAEQATQLATATPKILKDPTLPKNYIFPPDLRSSQKLHNNHNLSNFKLSAIFVGKNKKIAIINGQILHEGDVFGKCKIKNINESRVLIVLPGENNSTEELVIKLPATTIKGKE